MYCADFIFAFVVSRISHLSLISALSQPYQGEFSHSNGRIGSVKVTLR